MNLPEQLDLNTWLVGIELDPKESRVLIAQVFPEQGNTTSFLLFHAREGNGTFLEILEVVYETSFWAANPKELCLSIITEYTLCSDRNSPLELVYAYGGTINGRVPLVSYPPNTH
jgi:hypothetical protein